MPIIGNACSNENKDLHGGELGNQRKLKYYETGIDDYIINDELKIQPWVNLNSEDFSPRRSLKAVFRFKKEEHRELMAKAMINSCMNPYVGYDDSSSNRSTFRRQASQWGYSVEGLSKVNVPCGCDCSSLVSLLFYVVTKRDIGDTDTAHMADVIRNTGLCDEILVDDDIERFGKGLIPGDICVWRGDSSGHATVVVKEGDDVTVTYNQNNIPWISGITGVVITDDKKIYGQDKKNSISKSTKAFRIYSLDKRKDLQEINKVVVVDQDGIPNFIYGFSKHNFAFNLIGDSRTVQLGTVTLERNTLDNTLVYGLVPDINIFAWWGCDLVDFRPHYVSRVQYDVKGVVTSQEYSEKDDAFSLWLKNGNDEQAFRIMSASPDKNVDLVSFKDNNPEKEKIPSNLVGKMITIKGYVEYQDGLYCMPNYNFFFSPSPGDYSCPLITKVENASSATSTANTVSQIISIMENSSNTYQKFSLTQKAKDLVADASKSSLTSASFWFGINDVQRYKQAFLGNMRQGTQTAEQSAFFYVRSFVEEYDRLINLYLDACENFNNQENNIFITSIVSTSKREKDYYEEQGSVIDSINSYIKQIVEKEQESWETQSQGGEIKEEQNTPIPVWGQSAQKANCWLQYVELNLDANGKPLEHSQDFVTDGDFKDYIHFTRNWFETKYLSVFTFTDNSENVGEYTNDVFADYSAMAPKDWECSSRDINWYLHNYPRKILDWFVSQGYSPAFAIGIIANMRGESYFCPWICGDYSKDYNVSSKLWINVNGVPAPTTAPWFEPGGYADSAWRNGYSRVYRTQNENRPSSFGFCQWHNTAWVINKDLGGYDWQTNGLVHGAIDYRIYGYQAGRGLRMMNFCQQQASYKAPWSANPVGQLEYLVSELPSYSTVWAMRNIGSSMANARKVAEEFCRRFEMPPEVDARAAERANRAQGYWEWLIAGTRDYFGA